MKKRLILIVSLLIIGIILLIIFNKKDSCNIDTNLFMKEYNNQVKLINNYYPFSIFDNFKEKIDEDDIKVNNCVIKINKEKYIYKNNNFYSKTNKYDLNETYSNYINNISKYLFTYIKENYLLNDKKYQRLIKTLDSYAIYGDTYYPGDTSFAIAVGENKDSENITNNKVYQYFLFDFNKKEFTYSEILN